MAQIAFKQLNLANVYSYADYLSWEFQERLELLKGKIRLMSPAPNLEHQRISGRLFLSIGKYLETRPCELFSAPFDVRLPSESGDLSDAAIFTVVQPDLCMVCDPSKLDDKGCLGAPDLVIEILSPGNSQREIQEKYTIYEEAKVQEYWIVSPPEKWILTYLLDNEGKFVGQKPLSEGEILKSSLLPGLEIQLRDIFR